MSKQHMSAEDIEAYIPAQILFLTRAADSQVSIPGWHPRLIGPGAKIIDRIANVPRDSGESYSRLPT